MRSEKEMLDLVIRVAKEDNRVKAVCMNGSRTNPNVPKDPFRDYDIVYLVENLPSFLENSSWVDVFGERIIMQTPEDSSLFPPTLGGRFTYLMLFTDGNRIDLMLVPVEEKDSYCKEDRLLAVLLDKDNILPLLSEVSDQDYWVRKPTLDNYRDCINEFWWVSTYVVKGLWRRELLYAIDHMNSIRAMLLKMLQWKVGTETNFTLSVGKNNKYLNKYVDEDIWKQLLNTYPTGDYQEAWGALFTMIKLFDQVGLEVG
ncbi:MAG TPA: aminoglycoside 6-adenylyltransferase, partial [Niallia sp.]|nr:aminoglycoside 6-adenylyltransferase [Niallia sp.]